jgi:hypothetical protein
VRDTGEQQHSAKRKQMVLLALRHERKRHVEAERDNESRTDDE